MIKKTPEDYMNVLKVELDKGNNFLDYFVIIGVKNDCIYEDWFYESDITELNNMHTDKICPEILTKFPPFDKTTINVDESLIKHCFPNGYQIIESMSIPQPESFSFILDNNYFSIHFPQKYVACLMFYESLSSYKKLYSKYLNYHLDEGNSSFRSSKNFLYGSCDLSSVGQRKSDSSLINLSNCRDDPTISFKIRNNYEKMPCAKYKNYYAPKCICLVSVYPFLVEFGRMLKSIYNYSRCPKTKKPLEKVIANLIIEVPVPPRGLYSVEYSLFNEQYILTQSCMNKLPSINIELDKIFFNFNLDQILEVFKHVLLETKILFFSSNLSNITPIIQGFISFIYPFKYPFQVVTLLPNENLDFIESVSPYILGINMKYDYMFFVNHNVDISEITFLVVDIDNRTIELNSPNLLKIPFSDVLKRKKLMMEEFPEFPTHYKDKLEIRISDYINKIKSNAKQKEEREAFAMNIRQCFFYFVVSILQTYNQFLNVDYYTNQDSSNTSIKKLFRVDDYITSMSSSDQPFYKKLIMETQMFLDFIYKRMIPKDSKEKLEVLFFDEHINAKRNKKLFGKKYPTMFISSSLYDIRNVYSVQKTRNVNEYEINYFRNKENRKESLKFGQEVFFENNELFISYPIFPKLMTDVLFKTNAKEYFIPPTLSEELEPINIEMVSKSHLGNIEVHQSEMENYIYLCWLQLWAITFWYQEEEEKRYRFQQLLKVLDIVINHEMEIFNILFDTLSKHGEDYMIFKLYERLIHYRLNPSYSIYNIVSRLIDKNKILLRKSNGSRGDIVKHVNKYDYNKDYDVNKFRRRTIKNKYDINILDEEVKFYTFDSCMECQNSINLEKLSRDFNKMRRDILWAVCPFCGYYLLPKIGVQYGLELNIFRNLKNNTSTYEGVVLYSPFFLKYNYNNGLLKQFGIKLDVENFKINFNAIFWNSIWYFKIKNLEFDFMLPYEKRLDTTYLNKDTTTLIASTSNAPFPQMVNHVYTTDEEKGFTKEDCSICKKELPASFSNKDRFQHKNSSKSSTNLIYTGRSSFLPPLLHLDHSQEVEVRALTSRDECRLPSNLDSLCTIDAMPVTEQSFVNPSMLLDNSTMYNDSSSLRYLDSDCSMSIDTENLRRMKNPFNTLQAIKEDLSGENIVMDGTNDNKSKPNSPKKAENFDPSIRKIDSNTILIMNSEENRDSSALRFSIPKLNLNLQSENINDNQMDSENNHLNDFSPILNSRRKINSFRGKNRVENFFPMSEQLTEDEERDKTPIKYNVKTDRDIIHSFRNNYSTLRKSYLDVNETGKISDYAEKLKRRGQQRYTHKTLPPNIKQHPLKDINSKGNK